MSREKTTVETLGVAAAAQILEGDRRRAARLIRDLDDEVPSAQAALSVLVAHGGQSTVVGITGPPGAGKSSLLDALIAAYRSKEQTVGVLAMDPSSALTGGAVLGDRIRMQRHATDPGVFIRSFASRGHLGGLARSTFDAIAVLDALAFSVIFVETVGVGQDEMDIAAMADLTVVVTVPGLGDGVQAIKVGLLEMADVLVVNKSDLPGATAAVRDLEAMLAMRAADQRKVPIVQTSTIEEQGIDDLAATIGALSTSKAVQHRRAQRRVERAVMRLRQSVEHRLATHLDRAVGGQEGWHKHARAIIAGETTLAHAADELVETVVKPLKNQ